MTFLALRGRYVAVEKVLSTRDENSYGLWILDLRRGRIRHHVSPFETELPASGGHSAAVQEIVITFNGHTAWIARSLGSKTIRLHVYKVDRSGRDLLDARPNVERGTLRLRDRVSVGWRSDGARRTHRLTAG